MAQAPSIMTMRPTASAVACELIECDACRVRLLCEARPSGTRPAAKYEPSPLGDPPLAP
jgi:hypothetical protein